MATSQLSATSHVCPQCGGETGLPSSPDTKLCVCTSPASSSADSSSVAGTKTCCSCGINVAGKKRMRDSKGQYWCFECGQADLQKKNAATPCHACGKPYPTTALTRVGSDLVCPICHTQRLLTFRGKSENSLGSSSTPHFGRGRLGPLLKRNKSLVSLLAIAAALAVVLMRLM